MNLLNFGGSKVFELTGNAFDAVLPIIIVCAVSGLLAGFLIPAIAFRLGWLNQRCRKVKTMRILVLILFPLVFMIGSGIAGGALAAKDFTVGQVRETLAPINKFTFQGYQVYLESNWKNIRSEKTSFKETIKTYNSSIHYESRGPGFYDRKLASAANLFVPKVAGWGIEAVVETAANKEETTDMLELAKNIKLYRFKPNDWLSIEQIMTLKIKHYFQWTFILWVFILAVFTILPVMGCVWNRKSR